MIIYVVGGEEHSESDDLYNKRRHESSTLWDYSGGDQRDSDEESRKKRHCSYDVKEWEDDERRRRLGQWMANNEPEESKRVPVVFHFDNSVLESDTLVACQDLISGKLHSANSRLDQYEHTSDAQDERSTTVDIKSREWKGEINSLNAAIEDAKNLQTIKK